MFRFLICVFANSLIRFDPFLRVVRFLLKVFGIQADKVSDWMKTGLEKLLIKIGFSTIEAAEIVCV